MSTGQVRQRPGKQVGVTPDEPSLPPQFANPDNHSFVLQSIMEMQKCMGELTSSIKAMEKSHAKLDDQVERMSEKLSGVTHKIYGATAVMAVLVVIGGFIVNKAWDMMSESIKAQVAPAIEAAKDPDAGQKAKR